MRKIATIAVGALLPLAGWAQETVILKDGTQFNGRMTGATENSITFRDQRGESHRFDVDQVDSVHFDNSGRYNRPDNGSNNGGYNNSGGGYNNNSSYNGNSGDRDNRGYNGGTAYNGGNANNRSNNSYGNSSYVTIPAGTEIGVRTNETINSQDSREGRTYSAQVSRDVVDASGNVVIPRGSDAQLVVRHLGDNSVALDLQSVSINGQRYVVNTANISQQGRQGLGENKRTGEYVGGGALLGTLLGAVAGGGKGAAIGALAGGAAGAGAQVLTRGDQVRVPAETVLNFRLDSPLTLNPMQ